jgi:hypothetical protein
MAPVSVELLLCPWLNFMSAVLRVISVRGVTRLCNSVVLRGLYLRHVKSCICPLVQHIVVVLIVTHVLDVKSYVSPWCYELHMSVMLKVTHDRRVKM